MCNTRTKRAAKRFAAPVQAIRANPGWGAYDYDRITSCTLPVERFIREAMGRVHPRQPVYDMLHTPARRAAVFAEVLRPLLRVDKGPLVVFATVDDTRFPEKLFAHQIAMVWTGRRLYLYDPMGAWEDQFYGDAEFVLRLQRLLKTRVLLAPSSCNTCGIQTLIRRDACVYLACWGALELVRACNDGEDDGQAFRMLHDRRHLERQCESAAQLANTMMCSS